MVNYENGKIYKLYSPSKNIVYYGSTAEKYLSRRLQSHLAHYKSYKNNTYQYCKSFDVLECEDYKIELLEEVSCNNVEQLREREKYYILNNECINKLIPNRTHKEWYQNNKEHVKEKVICECGCIVHQGGLTRHRKTPKHIKLINNKIN